MTAAHHQATHLLARAIPALAPAIPALVRAGLHQAGRVPHHAQAHRALAAFRPHQAGPVGQVGQAGLAFLVVLAVILAARMFVDVVTLVQEVSLVALLVCLAGVSLPTYQAFLLAAHCIGASQCPAKVLAALARARVSVSLAGSAHLLAKLNSEYYGITVMIIAR